MNRFVKWFISDSGIKLAREINDYATANRLKIVSVSYASVENMAFSERVLVIFEKI